MALQTARAIATNLNHPKQSDGTYNHSPDLMSMMMSMMMMMMMIELMLMLISMYLIAKKQQML